MPADAIARRPFGTTRDGRSVDLFSLTSPDGAGVDVITYGGILARIRVPDRNGVVGDVALGYDDLGKYEADSPYFGALIGRVGNRIAKGQFTIAGTTYQVPTNNGANSLHGGTKGYDKRVWAATPTTAALKLTLTDPDGEQGYPGTVLATVVYTWAADGDDGGHTLRIEYAAVTDKPTPINLTNHSYFNLRDAGASPVYDHELRCPASAYLPVDGGMIPTGEVRAVAGTPIDFRAGKPIGRDLRAMGGDPVGYDHCLVLADVPQRPLDEAAAVYEPTTGRVMSVWTTEPGVQFYSGNFLNGGQVGRGGVAYQQHHAFCLESEAYPDAVNRPGFPNTVLEPGQTYRTTTEYRFKVAASRPW